MFVAPRIFALLRNLLELRNENTNHSCFYLYHPDFDEILKDKGENIGKPCWEPALFHALSLALRMEFSYCRCLLPRSCFCKDLKQQFTSDSEKWTVLSIGSHLTAFSLLLEREMCKSSRCGEDPVHAFELQDWSLRAWHLACERNNKLKKQRKILGRPWECQE